MRPDVACEGRYGDDAKEDVGDDAKDDAGDDVEDGGFVEDYGAGQYDRRRLL